jgi:hypothetical protein
MTPNKKTLETVTKVIAHPHKAITSHDRVRAAAILDVLSTEGPASIFSCLLSIDEATREQARILIEKL